MPPPTSPENLAMLRNLGIGVLLLLVPALAMRVTYFRGWVRRDDEPRHYWVAIACQAALGLFCFVGALLRS